MTVCLVINSLGGGGAERVFSRLANMLDENHKECKVVVITLDDEEIQNPLADSVEHVKLNCSGSLVGSIFALKAALNEVKPDVVVSFLTRSNVAAACFVMNKPTPVIISERVNTSSHFGSGAKSIVKKMFVRFFYAKSDAIVAVSEGVKQDLRDFFNLPEASISVIGNSYSYKDLTEKADECEVEFEDGSYLVCVGRFYKNKNHELLLRAMCKAKNPKKLLLLGDGPERSRLEALVTELGIEEHVVFKGFVRNPYPYIKRSAGLISASLAEGFPNVIAEALVLGKFVVSSDCQSGPAELLDNRVSSGVQELSFAKYGVLLPLNDLDATTAGIEQFNDSSVVTKYENAASALKEEFSHEIFLKKFVDTIKGVNCVR